MDWVIQWDFLFDMKNLWTNIYGIATVHIYLDWRPNSDSFLFTRDGTFDHQPVSWEGVTSFLQGFTMAIWRLSAWELMVTQLAYRFWDDHVIELSGTINRNIFDDTELISHL